MTANWLQLEDKVCVVTGAAGGIGMEIARELASVGARVALLDRDEAGAARAAADIAESGARAIALGCDITDKADVERAAAAVERELGRCDVLVNNAATIYAAALMDIDIERWHRLMAVNLDGFLLCAQAFGRQMIAAGGGSMVHVASISGRVPQPYSGPYSISKAGVKMLSQLLAVELGEHRIRSNVVSPAMVRTGYSPCAWHAASCGSSCGSWFSWSFMARPVRLGAASRRVGRRVRSFRVSEAAWRSRRAPVERGCRARW